MSDDQAAVYSVDEAARILGISRASAFANAKSGNIPTMRIGRRILVPKTALDNLLGKPGSIPPVLPAAAPLPQPPSYPPEIIEAMADALSDIGMQLQAIAKTLRKARKY
jgi:excisionase family DNA binding protein